MTHYERLEAFRDLDLRADDLREEDFLDGELRRDELFFDDELRLVVRLPDDLRDELFFDDFFAGTFAPARRAFERPIAIACLRLFTFLPERPLFNSPRLRSCIACLTDDCALLPYLAMTASSVV